MTAARETGGTPALLACNGVDKVEGALARESCLRAAELTGAAIVCPVLLNRSPAKYQELLAAASLVVIDGCGTRCASKLASRVGATPRRKLLISDAVKAAGLTPGDSLRLRPDEVALAESLAMELATSLTAEMAATDSAAVAEAAAPADTAAPPIEWGPPGEYLVVPYEQFEFRVPREGYLFSENDVWVRVQGGRARVGLTDYMQQSLTDIYYFDPPSIGTAVEQFGELGSVESSKAVFEIVAPLGGTVLGENPALVEQPGLINEDPYGEGWLVEVELGGWPEEAEFLLEAPAYAATLADKAAEG